MGNTVLTLTQVTRAALVILHQKLNFVGNINRQYDDSFAKSGAKIGSTLKVRKPNQFTVRTGANFSAQDVVEDSVTLTMATQKGIDFQFSSAEMTVSIQDFSDRYLEPAMSVLAANIEADCLTLINDVYQTVNNTTNTSISLATTLQAKKLLDDALAPQDGQRRALLNTQDQIDLVNALKGLFQDSKAIAEQYREGMMGRTAGFDFYENTLLTNLTSGTNSATSVMIVTSTIDPAVATGSIAVNQSTAMGTMVVGDVFTIATLNRVHPESKADTGVVQQFVVTTASVQGTTSSISFSPNMVMSGSKQNVISTAISTQAVSKIANTSRSLRQSLFFHRDAFTFVSADLVLPKGVHEAAREEDDGISMRMVTFYTGSTDVFGTRLDVLYGKLTQRPELAVKHWS